MSAETTKTFPAFKLDLFEDANAFVKCWSDLYNYPDYGKYKSLVTKAIFSEGDVRSLFEWKNGMKLSIKKEQSFLSHVLEHEDIIHELKRQFDQKKFDDTFEEMSAVWQIFLLHIITPSNCPIFDQHVYRAFMFIQHQDEKPLPFTQKSKLKIFHEEYCPFFLDMLELADEHDHFKIDKALWTFGKIINEYPGLVKVRV